VLSSAHDDAGFSEDPSVSRSRSTSEDVGDSAGATRASLGYAQLQTSTSPMAGRQKKGVETMMGAAAPRCDAVMTCDADAGGFSEDDFDVDASGILNSDDGVDGDMEEDDQDEEEDEREEEQEQEEPAQQICCVADFDEQKLEATTRWSKAHEARMCRVVEASFPGHGIICFERMYCTSRPVQDITRESLLSRDHILLPEFVASKVGNCACCVCCPVDVRCFEQRAAHQRSAHTSKCTSMLPTAKCMRKLHAQAACASCTRKRKLHAQAASPPSCLLAVSIPFH